ncbi:LLM class flavin-dependent oxidoreductase [Paractinoplanes ferrugineus]|uniref:Alkanesulfonate monooxygenase n=1 Tax=Paractinoplanes ferrugineus TaxID=113564 RepID=A0A919MF51_9ACTN|nr:LLM class flavin-dependent oxidoreductase [Actinoplanes ferrugineus]GIE13443.1 alkanesulfonate monooxygenase [Actinoplanes ferrugineus]
MPVEFIGLLATQDGSASTPATTALGDPAYPTRLARAHEDSGFDQVLVGHSSADPDGAQVAAYAAARTSSLKFLVAHRPGVVAPTLAARTFATLDQFTGGRVTLGIGTGGHDAEQRRTDEYLGVLRRAWQSTEPFAHTGAHYRFEDFVSEVKPVHGTIPIYFSGSSPAAYRTGVEHAAVYLFEGEPPARIQERITAVRAEAALLGRAAPGFAVSLRPVLGPTEELARARAESIVGRIGETAPAGTPETVARRLLDYYDLGVTTFLIHGYDPLDDAIDYGRELIPAVRAEIAKRDAARLVVT